MSDMPDFDAMTPEEMMAWMETLAKRQGADMETLTTSADADVADVSADDERLKDVGEYVPHGWTKEKWEEHLAKEAEAKASKGQQAQDIPLSVEPLPTEMPTETAPIEPPPIEPAPVTAMASTGDTPDFDAMSHEEMMAWMETLAKRQGADASTLVTAADAQVADVSADDERLKDVGEYIPYGWKKEDWEAHLAKEAEAKASQKQEAIEAPVLGTAGDEDDVEYYDDEEEALEYYDEDDDEYYDDEEALEEFYEEAPDSAPVMDFDFLNEEIDEELEEEDILQQQDMLDGAPDSAPVMDFSFLDDAIDEELEEDTVGAMQNPLDWLAELGGESLEDDSQAVANLSELSLEDPLASLASLGDNADDNPLAWLSGLASDTFPDEDTLPLGAQASADADEHDPIEWMESLSRRQGASDEELTTDANLDIPIPTDAVIDGPGYGEDYSFENPPNELQDTDETLIGASDDPSDWLNALASGMPDDLPDTEDASTQEIDEDAIMEALNQGGDVSPEVMQAFFERQFDKAEQFTHFEDDEVVDADAPPLPAEIPDWLQEQMGAEQDADDDELMLEGDDVLAALDLDGEPNDMTAIPDWLAGDMTDDEDMQAIFDDASLLDESEFTAQDAQEMAASGNLDTSEVDASDPWVQALAMERDQQAQADMRQWYDDSVRNMDSGMIDAVVSLESAQLDDEESLPMGEPRSVPDWLLAEGTPVEASPTETSFIEATPITADASDGVPDWLRDDHGIDTQDDMPDWLKEQVDEELDDADLPDWLADIDADVSVEDIPDWLRETMSTTDTVPTIEEEAPPPTPVAPTPVTPKPVVAQSPAPIAPIDQHIDVVQALQSARAKISEGNLESAIIDYENVVRANQALEQVTQDCSKLVQDSAHKHNPALYRVYGDALMRQGNLQQALDTYRRALNLL